MLAVAAAACAALVLVNGSKGAIGALLLGAACAAVAARGRISPRAMGSVAVALVLAAIAASAPNPTAPAAARLESRFASPNQALAMR